MAACPNCGAADVPPEVLPRLQRIKETLAQDDRVAAVVEED